MAGSQPTKASLNGLSWLILLVAMMQTGFGTFIAVNLTAAQWSQTDVGLAFSFASAAGILAQVPGGALVDAVCHKRLAAGLSLVAAVSAATAIALWQAPPLVFAAMVLQSCASAVLTPAIAAMTLAMVPHAALGERLGLNQRYASLGSACAAAAMGLAGAFVSIALSQFLAAGFGIAAVLALRRIAARDLVNAPAITDHVALIRPGPGVEIKWDARISIAKNRHLLVLAGCMLLFQLGNAGLLPLAVGELVREDSAEGNLLIAAAVIVSQLLAAVLAAPMGRKADTWGRRPILLIGLLALPVKAGLFALGGPNASVIVYQAVDALSAASLGMIVPLLVADITRRRGHFTLSIGFVGLAGGIGGTVGTVMAGALADWAGAPTAFLGLAGIGMVAGMLAWTLLPVRMDVIRPI